MGAYLACVSRVSIGQLYAVAIPRKPNTRIPRVGNSDVFPPSPFRRGYPPSGETSISLMSVTEVREHLQHTEVGRLAVSLCFCSKLDTFCCCNKWLCSLVVEPQFSSLPPDERSKKDGLLKNWTTCRWLLPFLIILRPKF